MIPTMELRFVERILWLDETENASKSVRILQQKWVHEEGATYTAPEWRDVPVEDETK